MKDEVFPSGYLQVSQETVSEYIGDYVLLQLKMIKQAALFTKAMFGNPSPAVQQNHILKVDANAFISTIH